MTDYIVSGSDLTSVADKIRSKGGTSAQLEFPAEFISAIDAISGGGGSAVVQALSVTQNGTYTPPSGVDGYAPVTVNVPGGGDDPFSLTDYIESSSINEYIDTGYAPKANSRFEMVATALSGVPNWGCFFGARSTTYNGSTGKPVMAWAKVRGNNHWGFGWGNSFNESPTTNTANTKLNIKLRAYGAGIETESGILEARPASTPNNVPPYSMYLCNVNTGGGLVEGDVTYCPMKLYRFRVYEDDALVMELLPYEDNGEACLKDSITGNLYKNAGTGAFTFGTDE